MSGTPFLFSYKLLHCLTKFTIKSFLGQKQFILLYWVLDGDNVELVTLDVGVDGGGGEVG